MVFFYSFKVKEQLPNNQEPSTHPGSELNSSIDKVATMTDITQNKIIKR